MVTRKCTDVFRGIFGFRGRVGGGGGTWEDISMDKLLMEEENFNERGAGFLALSKINNEK